MGINGNDAPSSDEEQNGAFDDFDVNWDDFDPAPDEDKIHLSDDGIDKIKSMMQDMPTLNHAPKWVDKMEENVWKSTLLDSLEHKSNVSSVMKSKDENSD